MEQQFSNLDRVMEAETISKNAASPKSHTNRRPFLLQVRINLKKVAMIAACLAVSLCSVAQNIFQNSQLIFEDERKTFAIYACWNVVTRIDKGQYGDENNVSYGIDMKFRVINKNDKILFFTVPFPRAAGVGGGDNYAYYPHEDCYTDRGIPPISYEVDTKTGKVTFKKLDSIDFKFYENPNFKPIKGKQSRHYVKLGDSNLE